MQRFSLLMRQKILKLYLRDFVATCVLLYLLTRHFVPLRMKLQHCHYRRIFHEVLHYYFLYFPVSLLL